MVKYKRLSKARALTIPKDISAQTGILAGMAVDMTAADNGILITKHIPSCVYCGSIESVGELRGQEICAKCAREIRKELDKIYA